ncbi:hypothetical protein N7468_008088 [Penicillium chermesinum]|uniref:Uncharacterized protein n=1 Tax=Penicillium chermesinum TaxID=63820 RepID=A0A9W9NP41_9EURO|nr:uncharacterized protein N7468_008088 [Penicillium chermesinum]KAJ5223546.1 hypothetical protein N7468_008088 [Penicillium chermesinum]KAJ6155624.1 hypothetical protein N7470_006190 [Penicillium chermesinum]
MSHSPSHSESKELQVKLFQYRGLVINSLNDEIKDNSHKKTLVLAGILGLLHVDIQQGLWSSFRVHLEGARDVIIACGGMRSLMESPGMAPLVLDFIFLVITGDTSSLASKLLVETLPVEELEFLILKHGGVGLAFRMCPPPLLVEVLRINHLRSRASRSTPDATESLQTEAFAILGRLDGFSADEWVESHDTLDGEFKNVAHMYQAAISLYGISSLQDCGILQASCPPEENCLALRGLTYELACKVLCMQRVKGV